MLERYIREKRKQKPILLMTHIVAGYPSFDESFEVVKAMVDAGVDLMELQIPFSEPIADGPVILHANQKAIAAGATVEKCLNFAQKVTAEFSIPFLFMTYYNILFAHGEERFCRRMAEIGIKGAIVPDLPPEEGESYQRAMTENGLSPIYIFAPTTSDPRLDLLSRYARGFVYCVARKGVTGAQTDFSADLDAYLGRCRKATDLPLALGFGVKEAGDVEFLKQKADIAVVGSEALRRLDLGGPAAVGEFTASLLK